MEFEIISDCIEHTLGQIWEMMFNDSIQIGSRADMSSESEILVAAVDISGAWEGRVLLSGTSDFGVWVASKLFDLEQSRTVPSADQIEDVLRELVNITGGSLKTVLPEPCNLSVPRVTKMTSSSLDNVKRDAIVCVDAGVDALRFNVAVVKSQQDQ